MVKFPAEVHRCLNQHALAVGVVDDFVDQIQIGVIFAHIFVVVPIPELGPSEGVVQINVVVAHSRQGIDHFFPDVKLDD